MIKKLVTISVIIMLAGIFSCSSNSVKDPDKIGQQAFDILKNLSQTSKKDYLTMFLTIEEVRELGRNEELISDADFRNDLTSIQREEWEGEIIDDYNDLKEDGGSYGLKWSEIEYLDFVYELEDDDDGITKCDGELFFKSEKTTYSVNVESIFDGSSYKLIEISLLLEE